MASPTMDQRSGELALSTSSRAGVAVFLQRIVERGALTGLTDAQLLQQFVRNSEGAAFEAMLRRHGPMVHALCQRRLTCTADVEDAFQATFLVLVKRARSIREHDALGPWLYGVAIKVTARVQQRVKQSIRLEAELMNRLRTTANGAVSVEVTSGSQELRCAIDDEIARLPARLREAVVLCLCEGLSYQAAARSLGWSESTLRGRLANGRKRLQTRLKRRGFAPASCTTGALGLALRPAQVTETLIETTLCAGKVFACAATATIVTVNGLVSDVLRELIWSSAMRKVLPLGLSICVLAVGVSSAARWGQERQRTGEPGRAHAAVQGERVRRGSDGPTSGWTNELGPYVVEPPDLLIVELSSFGGVKITGERLVRPDGTISLGFYGDVPVAGLTLPEVKVKVIEALSRTLSNEALGLVAEDINGKTRRVAPADSTSLFVDVAAYNSKVYYVTGDVGSPGRIPVTGNDRVIDAITYAGNPTPHAAHINVRLVRPGKEGEPPEVLPVDYEAIVTGDDLSTNYRLHPNDRLHVYHEGNADASTVAKPPDDAQNGKSDIEKIEDRLSNLETKLDAILKAIEKLEGRD